MHKGGICHLLHLVLIFSLGCSYKIEDTSMISNIPEEKFTVIQILNLQTTNETPKENNLLSYHNYQTTKQNLNEVKSTQLLSENHPSQSLSDTSSIGSSGIKPTLSVINSTLKIQKTDAPMLNYIFDTHLASNKHHHHDQRYGPHFEDIKNNGNITNITVQAGDTAYLNCRISLLQDKTVSWVRRKHDGQDLQLLTVGMHTYSGDSRYTVELQYPNNWKLKILYANKKDEGLYECQISTHPPRVIQIYLQVNAPQVTIVDEHGFPLINKYYEVNSTIQITCLVRFIAMSSSVVYWYHGNRTLNYDITRGGISVKTDLMDDGANSILFIAKVNKSDSGNYTCSIGSAKFITTVHVLNGESLAELYHGGSTKQQQQIIYLYLVLLLFYILSQFKIVLR